MLRLNVNGEDRELDMDPTTPLLWAIRDGLKLTGTKFSCGIKECGSCTVLLDGVPIRSCGVPIALAVNKKVTTIEGLSSGRSHPVQQAWIEEEVPQCGYCHSGQIMAAVAFLKKHPNPTDADIDRSLRYMLCRCGTYPRIRKAIKRAAEMIAATDKEV